METIKLRLYSRHLFHSHFFKQLLAENVYNVFSAARYVRYRDYVHQLYQL